MNRKVLDKLVGRTIRRVEQVSDSELHIHFDDDYSYLIVLVTDHGSEVYVSLTDESDENAYQECMLTPPENGV